MRLFWVKEIVAKVACVAKVLIDVKFNSMLSLCIGWMFFPRHDVIYAYSLVVDVLKNVKCHSRTNVVPFEGEYNVPKMN